MMLDHKLSSGRIRVKAKVNRLPLNAQTEKLILQAGERKGSLTFSTPFEFKKGEVLELIVKSFQQEEGNNATVAMLLQYQVTA